MFEKAKFNRLKTIILKSITKDMKVLIKLWQTNKSSNEIYRKEINLLSEELKCKDFVIKALLQTIKEIKTRSISVQFILSCMSSSEVNS